MKHMFNQLLIAGIAACSPFFYSQSFAQSQHSFEDFRISRISINYAVALESPNLGVAESALYHSVLFQKKYTGSSDERIQKSVKKLYSNVSDDRIQHKAYLVDRLLSLPGMLNRLPIETIKTEQDFYRTVADLLNDHFNTTATIN